MAPTFGKGYSRKGAVQFFMKDYDKALATYQAGLTHDPDSDELKGARTHTQRTHTHTQRVRSCCLSVRDTWGGV